MTEFKADRNEIFKRTTKPNELQQTVFKSICELYDMNKDIISAQTIRHGINYTSVELNFDDRAIEEIRSWIKE